MQRQNNNSEGFLRNLLNNTLKEMMSVVGAECGSLFLFNSNSRELVLNSFYNSGNLNLQGLRQKVGDGISGKVIDMQTPILVKDISTDSRFNRNGFNHYRTNSFISIPLLSQRGILGLINLADKSSGEPFSEKDLEFAVVLSKYVCLAIENLETSVGVELEKYASVGKLAVGIVHEINNPLDGVIRYTNILLEQMSEDSVSKEYLLEIKKGLNRITNITKSLLQFSYQVGANSSQVEKYVDINMLIEEALDTMEDRLNGKIMVNKRYKERLPRILDFGLAHIVTNIIKNALDAMSDSGGTLDISTDVKDSSVRIIFQDTGPGISAEIRDRIFEPFFSTKSIDKGAGLGLSICKEIINRYDGNIEVNSSPGKGAAFNILIPKRYLENE